MIQSKKNKITNKEMTLALDLAYPMIRIIKDRKEYKDKLINELNKNSSISDILISLSEIFSEFDSKDIYLAMHADKMKGFLKSIGINYDI